jgi:hypothetical protein
MPERVTNEQIAAYVDGTLDDATAARVAEALAQDGAARAYAAELEIANRLLQQAFGAPMTEPVPAELRDIILRPRKAEAPGEVVELAQRRWRQAPFLSLAVAASVALMIGAGTGTLLFTQAPPQHRPLALLGPAPTDGPLHAALEQLPSGEISAAGVQPMLTFRDASERVCREFEVIGEVPDSLEFGIACRRDASRWQVEIVVTGPASDIGPDGYRPASGPGADALDAMLDALGAQPALTPLEESELLRRGWR